VNYFLSSKRAFLFFSFNYFHIGCSRSEFNRASSVVYLPFVRCNRRRSRERRHARFLEFFAATILYVFTYPRYSISRCGFCLLSPPRGQFLSSSAGRYAATSIDRVVRHLDLLAYARRGLDEELLHYAYAHAFISFAHLVKFLLYWRADSRSAPLFTCYWWFGFRITYWYLAPIIKSGCSLQFPRARKHVVKLWVVSYKIRFSVPHRRHSCSRRLID